MMEYSTSRREKDNVFVIELSGPVAARWDVVPCFFGAALRHRGNMLLIMTEDLLIPVSGIGFEDLISVAAKAANRRVTLKVCCPQELHQLMEADGITEKLECFTDEAEALASFSEGD